MRFALRSAAISGLLVVAALSIGCGSPPDKEMHQAQGAIDAAHASGAEQYATEDYRAAVAALKQSQEAVEQRDYRLALGLALDSRERAQKAAKTAADQKAVVRSEAEQGIREASTALVFARDRLKAAETARASARTLAAPRRTIASADDSLQKARAALARGEYLEARAAIAGVTDRVRGATRELEPVIASRPARRRR